MNNNFRKLALKELASKASRKSQLESILKQASLTSLVQESLQISPDSNFREEFLSMPPGAQRENFVLQEIIKRKPIGQLRPITVPGPGGSKITYYVMPDFITIDGIRVPMAGQTAQRVADHFGMHLPNTKQSRQIWEQGDVKMRPPPLSSGGRIGGRYYSGQEVVNSKISDSDAAVAYSDMIQKELEERGGGDLIVGQMKDIIQSPDPNKLGLYGWFGEDGEPLEPSKITSHDTTVHSEYGAGARLIGDTVTITLPNGKSIRTNLEKVVTHPVFGKSLSETPGYHRYSYD